MPQKQHIIHGRDNAIVGMDPIPPGRWVYVGDYPSDPDTTAESPPFQNSWVNAGGGSRRLRFRRTNENQTEIAGSVVGGTPGTVVTTLPVLYRVTETEFGVGANDGVISVWQLAVNGELTLLGSVAFTSGASLTGIFYDITNTGATLDVESTSGDITFDTGANQFRVFGDTITLSPDTDITATLSGVFGVFADTEINLISDSTGFQIEPALIFAQLDTGAVFEIRDSAGDPVFRITDGGTDVHIKTGWSIVADL